MSVAPENTENQLDHMAMPELRLEPVDRKLMDGRRIQVAFMIFTGLVVMVLTGRAADPVDSR
jgi:hypothetical protein